MVKCINQALVRARETSELEQKIERISVCHRVLASSVLSCFVLFCAPLKVWHRGGRGCWRGRTHLRAERGVLPERCRAPQGGTTPLHSAALRGHAAVVEQLLAAGAAKDAKDAVRGSGSGRVEDRKGSEGSTRCFLISSLLCVGWFHSSSRGHIRSSSLVET